MYKILAKLPFKTNHVHYLPSCHSTNEVAQELLRAEVVEGTIVVTDNQLAGKGQRGSKWQAEPGQNLTFSLILHPQFLKPNEQFFITVAVSLGIIKALTELLTKDVKIKWPNDIYVNNKKIAGLLIENVLRGSSIDSCVVGLGLNVNQVGFAEGLLATSLKNENQRNFALNKVLNTLMMYMSKYYFLIKDGHGGELMAEYHKALLGFGEKRRFSVDDDEFIGIITGTDEFGRLLINRGNDAHVFQHKEVRMLF